MIITIIEVPGPPTVQSTRSTNEITLMIDYNQTRWDLYLYQISVIDRAGMIISHVNTSHPMISLPINENFWELEVVTYTRCFQKSPPYVMRITDSEVDNAPINGILHSPIPGK